MTGVAQDAKQYARRRIGRGRGFCRRSPQVAQR